MSHFACIVIGDDIEKQLQPYHEFECTGTDDEYVQEIDNLESIKKDYESKTKTYVLLPSGDLIPYESPKMQDFWRDMTDEESELYNNDEKKFKSEHNFMIRPKPNIGTRGYQVWDLPPDHKKVAIPISCILSFLEYVKDSEKYYVIKDGDSLSADEYDKWKYDYAVVDKNDPEKVIKVITRTNPRKKWDWWVIGGRWRGYFKLKPGCPGTLGEKSAFAILQNEDNEMPGRADCARKGDIDWDGMRQDAADAAAKRFDEIAAIAPITWESFDSILKKEPDAAKARAIYYSQESIKKLCDVNTYIPDMDSFLVGRDAYIADAAKYATIPFAFIKDSQWFSRGSMGWWGIVFDEDPDKQCEQWQEIFDALPDDTLMTCVDCHI